MEHTTEKYNPKSTALSATFFLKIMNSPMHKKIGAAFLIAGLALLSIGLAFLCPPIAPVLAGMGMTLSTNVAKTLAVTGGVMSFLGLAKLFFSKPPKIAGISNGDYFPLPQS